MNESDVLMLLATLIRVGDQSRASSLGVPTMSVEEAVDEAMRIRDCVYDKLSELGEPEAPDAS